MSLPRHKREEVSSTLTQTLSLVAVCSTLCALSTFGSDPAWWASRGAVLAPVVTTNGGVVTTNYVPNDYAVVTQGQLKQFTARAVDELNARLTNGAGSNLNAMVSGWAADYATNGYGATNIKPSDFTAMNVGQLKAMAGMVYGRLSTAGYVELTPSWLHQNTNSDNAAANLGQLKQIFNFDFSLPGASNLTATLGSGGTAALTWMLPGTNNATSWLIEQQNTDGSWSVLDTLNDPNATSYSVTGLTSGQSYNFQVIGVGANSVSLPTGATASSSYAQTAATPTISPAGGTYSAVQVTLRSSTLESTDVALASNGSTAVASSSYSGFSASSAIDGDRTSINWGGDGGWNDDTPDSYPDWLEVDFDGSKTISEMDVFTLPDSIYSSAEPTLATTFNYYGITDFEAQYWNGTAWVDVPNGNVTGNNKVWRQFTFSPITTPKVRVLVNNADDTYSRITEVEAWSSPVAGGAIHYTLDGTTPNSSSPSVASGGTVTLPIGTQTLKAITSVPGYNDSTQASETFTVTGLPPAAPTNVTVADEGGGQYGLTWTNTNSDVAFVTVQVSSNGGTTWTNAGTFAGSTASATIGGLDPSGTYSFRVIASNATGNSAPSSTATITTTAPPQQITASITSPNYDTTVFAGGVFQFTVSATTSAGAIQQVDFYIDSTYLGSSNTFPYTISMSSSVPGAHHLQATVENSLGNAMAVTEDITVLTPLDSNGLPFAWELQYFSQLGIDPSANPDGDGSSNLQEYQNGTDPTDYYNGEPATLTIIQGDNQTAWTGRYLDQALEVLVTRNGTPLVNAPVNFSVSSGSGFLVADLGQAVAGQMQAVTNASGIATIYYYQPSDFTGSINVTATASSSPTSPGVSDPVNFPLSAPSPSATAPTGGGTLPPGTLPTTPTDPPPPSDGTVQLYSETVTKTKNKVGFDTFTTTTPPRRYLVENEWDERSGPVPQGAASATLAWDPETETEEPPVLSGTITPDMFYGGGDPTTDAELLYYSVYGPYGDSTDAYSYTISSEYTTDQLVQRTIKDLPGFTGNLTPDDKVASYELASDETSFGLQQMQYQFVSTSSNSTTLNWLIVFTPDDTSQPILTKSMNWTGAANSFQLNRIDPAAQTYDNGTPASKNGTITVQIASIEPDEGQIQTTGDIVPSTQTPVGQKHYVSPQQSNGFVVLKANVPSFVGSNFSTYFEWDTIKPDGSSSSAGQAVTGSPEKWQVKRDTAGHYIVRLKSAASHKEVARINIWIVWTTADVPTNGPLATSINSTNTSIQANWNGFIFHVVPSSILDTSSDVPDLRGANKNPPPIGNEPALHVLNNLPLAGGADFKWDTSQQIECRILNPKLFPKSAFPTVPGVLFNSQPVADVTPQGFPDANSVVGNDDVAGGPEPLGPYATSDADLLEWYDTPTMVMLQSTGQVNDTIEFRLAFRTFARLEINGGWFRISDNVLWRTFFKMKKAYTQITTGPDGVCNTTANVNDFQNIPLGHGEPGVVAITAGTGGLHTTPGGDDVVVGNTITTGPDGICNTTATGGDNQIIANGKGSPNKPCVTMSLGSGQFNTSPVGDDQLSNLVWTDNGSDQAHDNNGF